MKMVSPCRSNNNTSKQVHLEVANKKSDVATSELSDFERQCFANYLAVLDNEGGGPDDGKGGGEAKGGGAEDEDVVRMSI